MAEAPRSPQGAHVRGSLLVHMHAHVLHEHGAAGWTRLVDAVPAPDREQLGALLISGTWYRVGLWNRAWRAYLATSGREPGAEMRALAKRVADADLHTVFKLTLKLASPTQVIRRVDWLWTRYFDVGAVTVQEVTPTTFRSRLEAPNGDDDGPNEAICAHGVPAWLTHALTLSGAANASVQHTKCRFTFARYCEYRIVW